MAEPLALGIDIGGTNTSFGIVDRRGNILRRGHTATKGHTTVHDYISVLRADIATMTQGLDVEALVGAGVGAPSANYYTGEIPNAPNLPWGGVIPLRRLLGDALNTKVTVTNDANAATIGEMMYGAAKGMKDFILVTLGTGLGSGFVSNGQLIYGHDGFAGELGHVIAIRDGRKCGCGRLGCLETYASATGIVRTANEWLSSRTDDSILRGHKDELTSRHVFEAAAQGDAFALAIFAYTGKILGMVLADAVAITSPKAIIFFGGAAKAGDLLMSHVQQHMEDNLLHIYKNKVSLLYSSLPDADAAILGASALVW